MSITTQQQTCRSCQADFVIQPEDFAFYEKMTFAAPTLCPLCRLQRRQIWRNERKMYRRKSDKSGKDIVSLYAPNSSYTVYSLDEWWNDDWDALSYGQDIDFTRPFFEQLDELFRVVPRLPLFNAKTENCEYVNYTADSSNCYLSSVVYYGCEDIYHSYFVFYSKDCVDVSDCYSSEGCYELASSRGCYNCHWSNRLQNCRNVYFSQDLVGCSDCVLCTNLTRKQYCIRNQQLTKDEYEHQLAGLNMGSRVGINALQAEFDELRTRTVVKYATITNSEDSTGNDVHDCKNVRQSFGIRNSENMRYSFFCGGPIQNAYDVQGGTFEWGVECNNTGIGGAHFLSVSSVLYSSFVAYSEMCYSSHNLFGCVGLRGKKFCILNKQYTEDEYKALTAKLIEHMKNTGEWGEFFPMRLSPFGYNETAAYDSFPLGRAEALALGAKWQEEDYSPQPSGQPYQPAEDIAVYRTSETERQSLLVGVINCDLTGRPFKVTSQELAFYLRHDIPIPTRHPDVRYQRRFDLRGRLEMHQRQCQCEQPEHEHAGRCAIEFETIYASDRTETVYCERCYQKVIS